MKSFFARSSATGSGGTTTFRKAAAVVAGGGVYATAMWISYQYVRSPSSPTAAAQEGRCGCGSPGPRTSPSETSAASAPSPGILASPNRTLQFERIASFYDDRIRWDESFMGIQLLRRFLLRNATGDVLEVGCGTARNLPYYRPDRVRRLVLTDSSPAMLDRARSKIRSAAEAGKLEGSSSSPPRTIAYQADAHRLPLPDRSFDTVVDTFGLCSYDDPVAVLGEISRVCKPSGRILLLEHGRTKKWDWLSAHLDRTAPTHAANWGCVWNRDLDDILERSGLRVESIHTWHFGTTYYVVCRPASRDADGNDDEAPTAATSSLQHDATETRK